MWSEESREYKTDAADLVEESLLPLLAPLAPREGLQFPVAFEEKAPIPGTIRRRGTHSRYNLKRLRGPLQILRIKGSESTEQPQRI